MKNKKSKLQQFARVLMVLSFVAVLLATWGFLFSDVWLASTQWLLTAAVLAGFGLYIKMES